MYIFLSNSQFLHTFKIHLRQMSLKYTYQRFTSIILLFAMLWNISGWLGMGLINAHFGEHTDGEHCEVTFCYCKVENGDKICTCHHPELHAKGVTENHDTMDMSDGDMNLNSYCYYSKSHDSPVQPDAVILITDFHSTLPYFEKQRHSFFVSDYLNDYSCSLSNGFAPNLLRPPSA